MNLSQLRFIDEDVVGNTYREAQKNEALTDRVAMETAFNRTANPMRLQALQADISAKESAQRVANATEQDRIKSARLDAEHKEAANVSTNIANMTKALDYFDKGMVNEGQAIFRTLGKGDAPTQLVNDAQMRAATRELAKAGGTIYPENPQGLQSYIGQQYARAQQRLARGEDAAIVWGDVLRDAQLLTAAPGAPTPASSKKIPEGFELAPDGGGLRPVKGGPKDPAYLRAETVAKDKELLATNTNPYATGKFNETQGKAASFSDRMFQSEAILNDFAGTDGKVRPGIDTRGESLIERGVSAIPVVGNYLVGQDYQSYDQAKRDFINAQLRRESGAVISDKEFDNAHAQYFPRPGDSPETVAQKRANRRAAIEGMAREGGPAYRPKFMFNDKGQVFDRQQSQTQVAQSPSAPRVSQPRPAGVSDEQLVAQASQAIASGKDRNAVIQRLKEWGIDLGAAN